MGEWVKRYRGGAEPKGRWEGAPKVRVGKEEGIWYLARRILGARGPREVVAGCGEGRKQKADQQGFREQTSWVGRGPKKGKPEEQLGFQVSDRGLYKPGKARTGGWERSRCGLVPSLWGYPSPLPLPRFQFFSPPRLLERH